MRELRGWLITPSGKGIKLGKDSVFDRMYSTDPNSSNDLYMDVRERGVACSGQVDPGGVFGYESISEERPLLSQIEWYFQDRLPVVLSRLVLTVPPGWRAQETLPNAPNISSDVRDNSYTWEGHNLPYIEPEPLSPPIQSLTPRVLVSYFPPTGKTSMAPAFATWKEVSAWLTPMADSQAQPTPELSAKAKELTASAKSEMDRLQALGRFVQGLKYISIQTGVAHGGGYRPHSAESVLQHLYGDCKDKSTLLRALLKAEGIDSYMVTLYSRDRYYVREDFPSPEQFNHAIVAAKVSDGVRGPAVVEVPGLGRLLLIDATATFPPVGAIPADEQGTLGLINAGESGTLIRFPFPPPGSSVVQANVEASLSDDGHLAGTRMNGRDWKFVFPKVSELHNDRLMMFRPPLPIFGGQLPSLTASVRKYPLLLNPASYRETLRVKLPQNFKVEELPDPQKLEAPFGSYSGVCTLSGGQLVITRSLEIRPAMVPVTQYGAAREFFERIATFEQTPVTLTRQ